MKLGIWLSTAVFATSCGKVQSQPPADASSDAAELDAAPDAAPVTVELAPAADADLQDSNVDGVFDIVRPPTNEVVIVRRVSSDEFRAAFEFDLSSIPMGRMITSAKLTIQRALVAGGVIMQPHGYSGDGAITLSDANINAPIAPAFSMASSAIATIDLTSFVGPLRGSGVRYAGVLLRPTNQSDLTSIHSAEAQTVALRPKLEIIYQ